MLIADAKVVRHDLQPVGMMWLQGVLGRFATPDEAKPPQTMDVGAPDATVVRHPSHGGDDELMLAYSRGAEGAFDTLYQRYGKGVYNYLLQGCGTPALAADLAQETWLSLVRNRGSYQARSRFSAYLFHVAHNKLVDYWRRPFSGHSSLADLTVEPADLEADQPDVAAEIQQERQRLQRAIAALPAEQRQAFLLQQEGELSLEEIAAITGVGRETVKSRLRYALAKLRLELTDE